MKSGYGMCRVGSLFMLMVIFGSSNPLHAAGIQTGEIVGAAYDQDGIGIAGVKISATSTALIGEPRQTLTDRSGSFRLVELPPGRYDVTARRMGLAATLNKGVRVKMGAAASLYIVMKVPTAKKTFVVAYEQPTVDSERVASRVTLSRDSLEKLPTERDYQSIAVLAPGASWHPVESQPTIRGGTMYDNQYLIDGMNTTNPFNNTWSTNVNFDAIEEIQVLTGGLDAEYGQALGGIVNVITRSGGNRFDLDSSFYFGHDALGAAPLGAKEGGMAHYNANLNLSGPIIRDKLWYFFTAEYAHLRSALGSQAGSAYPEHPAMKENSLVSLGKLTWKPSSRHQLQLVVNTEIAGFHNREQNPALLPTGPDADTGVERSTAELFQTQGGVHSSLRWTFAVTPKLLLKASGMLGYRVLDLEPQSDDLATPAHVDQASGAQSANAREIRLMSMTRADLDLSLTYFANTSWGNHEIKGGFQWAPTWTTSEEGAPGDAIYNDRGGFCDPDRNAVSGCHQLVRVGTQDPATGELIPGRFVSKPMGQAFGLFLQDRFKPKPWLTFRLGWRVDIGWMQDDGQTITRHDAWVGPRVGAAWDILQDSTTVLRAFYGRYNNTGFLIIPSLVGRSQRRETYGYNTSSGKFDQLEFGTGGSQGGLVDPSKSKSAPRTDEVIVGIERQIFEKTSLELSFTYRLMQNLFRGDEVNIVWNKEGDDFSGFRNFDASAQYYLVTPNEARRRYLGLDLILRANPHPRWQLFASYTWSQLEGNHDLDTITDYDRVMEIIIDNPRQRGYLWGPLQADRRHVIKVRTAYTLRRPKITLGLVCQYATGRSYDRLYYNNVLGAYVDRRAPRGVDPGDINDPGDDRELRLPDTLQIDLSVRWDLSGLIGQRLELIAQTLNVLNLQPAVRVEERNVDGFGQITNRQDPFRLELGVRYRY